MHLIPIQDFSQKNACNKRERNFYRKVFELHRFSKVFPNVGENAQF